MYLDVVLQRRELLLIALLRKAQEQRLTTAQLAVQLDLSEEQLFSLVLGVSRVERIGADTAGAMAAYLEWPVVGVWFASGALRLEDFFTAETLEQAHADACSKWPQLKTASELCAVLALVVSADKVLSQEYLCDLVKAGPQ